MTSYLDNMKIKSIVIEGLSEEQVRRDIERGLAGWKLLLQEPQGVEYQFINPFFGHPWDGTAEDLRRIITTYGKIQGKQKHMILRFQWNGEDRFAWCSWERVLYDCETEIKHHIEPKYSINITELIHKLFI